MRCFISEFEVGRCPYAPEISTGHDNLDILVEGHMLIANGLRSELQSTRLSTSEKLRIGKRVVAIDQAVDSIVHLTGVSFESLDLDSHNKPLCRGMPFVEIHKEVISIIHCDRDV